MFREKTIRLPVNDNTVKILFVTVQVGRFRRHKKFRLQNHLHAADCGKAFPAETPLQTGNGLQREIAYKP